MTIMNGTKKAGSQALINRPSSKCAGLLPTATGRASILRTYVNNATSVCKIVMYGSTTKGLVGHRFTR